MAQSTKKPRKTHISDEDWNRYVEALRREGGAVGVFVLREGDTLAWQPVETGAASVTRVQVVKGLNDGDAVALPAERPLRAGMQVQPVYQ